MKKIEVRLKIEEMFNYAEETNLLCVYFHQDCLNDRVLLPEVRKLIDTKVIRKEPCRECDHEEEYIEKNESRGTIINALWDYQQKLLSDKYFMQQLGSDIFIRNKISETYFKSFYSSESRIITITKFIEDKKEK